MGGGEGAAAPSDGEVPVEENAAPTEGKDSVMVDKK
jgi:hypothetical protein